MKIVLFWKKISSLFKYSERTVASTVTNDISAESSWSQLLGARQTRAWHDQEGVTPTFRKGHWKKKQIWRSKFRLQKKNFLMQFLIFFCYELNVCSLIFKSDKVYFASSLIAKPNKDPKFWVLMGSNVIFRYDWPIKPQNLCPWLVKSSQSNFNLRLPDCYWVRSYLITTVRIKTTEKFLRICM